jgi:hypothetical protein
VPVNKSFIMPSNLAVNCDPHLKAQSATNINDTSKVQHKK